MKVIFVIDTPLIRMRVKVSWGFPHLPRKGEMISPRIIMLQEDLSYQKISKYMTNEGEADFKKYYSSEENTEACFREWIYDVISNYCVIESIVYSPDPDNDKNIVPKIHLSD